MKTVNFKIKFRNLEGDKIKRGDMNAGYAVISLCFKKYSNIIILNKLLLKFYD